MKWLLCCCSSLILLLISAPARAKEEVEQEDRIVNGSVVQPGQFKWVAGLYFKRYDAATNQIIDKSNFTNQCGGAIVSQKFILTAAHCFYVQKKNESNYWVWSAVAKYNENQVQVVVGVTNSNNPSPNQFHLVQKIHIIPNYNNQSYSNDIALLELQKPLNESEVRSDSYQVIPIYRENIGEKEVKATVAGWGDRCYFNIDNGFIMKYINVTTAPFNECGNDLGHNKSTDNSICAWAQDQNVGAGDSGGGLWMNAERKNQLIGLVSTIFYCNATGLKPGPGPVYAIYTRVSHFQSWINQTMGSS